MAAHRRQKQGNAAGQREAGASAQRQGFSEETDGPRIHPSILRVLAGTDQAADQQDLALPHRSRQSFRSLDRGVRAFLRSSNLPGLEYRLRIAGYNTLTDLLEADEEALCAHGFTPLMSRRLLGALEEYILRQLHKSEGIRLPFQLVRKGQKINSDPSEKMKALPTYGKQNVKRPQRFLEPAKMGRKRSSGSKGPKVAGQTRPVSYLRLMSEEHLPNEPIFPNDVIRPEAAEGAGPVDAGPGPTAPEDQPPGHAQHSEEEGESPSPGVGDAVFAVPPSPLEVSSSPEGAPGPEGVVLTSQLVHGPEASARQLDPITDVIPRAAGGMAESRRPAAAFVRLSVPVFQEFFLPDQVDVGERWLGGATAAGGQQRLLRRCGSVPADYRFHVSQEAAPLPSWCMLVRSYSCPASLVLPPSQIESTLLRLTTSQDLGMLVSALEGLCSACRGSEVARKEAREKGGMEVLVDLLVSLCTNPRIVENSLKLMKLLTREASLEGVVPAEGVAAVLQAMECHPFSERVLAQGCLAIGNIGRSAPSQCEQLLSARCLTTLSHVMETFPSSLPLQVSALSALGVGLGCWPQGRLGLLEEQGRLLDLVLAAVRTHPHHQQLQEYACSFMALLMAEVAVEMESGVVQLMVEQVCIAMATHPQAAPVALWCAKALANAASNAALSDPKLAGRCCDLLAECLRAFSGDQQVWTWSMFALLRLVATNGSVKGDLIRGGVVSLLKTPPHDLPDYGMQYLEQLLASLY